VFTNPALDPAAGSGSTNYLQATGESALFRRDKDPAFAFITDGTSNTIAVVESSRMALWTRPDDLEVNPARPLADLNFRPGGFLALFADGHVSFVPTSFPPETLANLFNPQDGNPTPTP
jgi:prepilin-type processing-associated H-X9-DG protein